MILSYKGIFCALYIDNIMDLSEINAGVYSVRIKLKRLKINKVLRVACILVTALMLGIVSFLLYKEVMIPKIVEEKSKLYFYTNESSIDYNVLLKPNSIYSNPTLGEGQYYITNYVDELQATFHYEFTGDRAAGLKGSYEVAAVVEGYIVKDEKHITIWEKKYSLLPETDFDVKEKLLSLKESVNIKLSEYNDFAAAISEDSKVQIPMQLNVYMDVNLKADIDKDQVETKIAPTITIPLDESYFSITESDTKEEPGCIEETRNIQLPPNKQKLIIFKCELGASLVLLLGILIFTEAVPKSPFTRQLDKIFKVYGNRLVALSSELLAASLDNCNIVRSIDDLVRVADEIGRPIMYEYSEDYKDIVHFYVLDDKRTYLYILRDILPGSNVVRTDEKEVAL